MLLFLYSLCCDFHLHVTTSIIGSVLDSTTWLLKPPLGAVKHDWKEERQREKIAESQSSCGKSLVLGFSLSAS